MARHERVTVYADKDGRWRWRKRPVTGGRNTGASEQSYAGRAYAASRAAQENPGQSIEVLNRDGSLAYILTA